MRWLYIIILIILFSKCNNNTTSIHFHLNSVPSYSFLEEKNYFIWGASMVKEHDSLYHIYYSRWPKNKGFNAWLTHSEIAHGTSKKPLGPYVFSDVTLKPRGREYWDGLCTHNPSIHKFEGKYYLYYMGNTGDGKVMKQYNFTHRNNQRIGVAVSQSPYGPWKRQDIPLIDVSNNKPQFDALCLSNPSVLKTFDNKYLMIYKAVAKEKPLPLGGPIIHLSAISDNPDGPFVKRYIPLFTSEKTDFATEDPYIFKLGGRYFAILKDMQGSFTGEKKSLALFESIDGIEWNPSNNPLVSKPELRDTNGVLNKVDRLERPQLYINDEGIPEIMFLAVQEGNKTYNVHIPIEIKLELTQ
jgi:predicted GH43/DUF377 family glycosyl hydrolase